MSHEGWEQMALPRLHLFELEDLEWFPHTIRNLALDYLDSYLFIRKQEYFNNFKQL